MEGFILIPMLSVVLLHLSIKKPHPGWARQKGSSLRKKIDWGTHIWRYYSGLRMIVNRQYIFTAMKNEKREQGKQQPNCEREGARSQG